MRRLLVLLAVSLLALTACDSGGSGDTGDSGEAVETTEVDADADDSDDSAGSADSGDDGGEASAVEAGLLDEADLPAEEGWSSTPPSEETDDFEEVAGELPQCEGFTAFEELEDEAELVLDSDDFTREPADQASNEIRLFDGEAAAAEAFETLGGADALADCVAAVFPLVVEESGGDLPPDAEVSVTDAAAEEPVDLGDDVAGVQATIRVSSESAGLEIVLVADLDAVRVGPAIDLFVFTSLGGPLEEAPELVRASVERLEAALS